MTKQQAYLASTLCLLGAFTFVLPIACMGYPIIAIILFSLLAVFSVVFFLIGINK